MGLAALVMIDCDIYQSTVPVLQIPERPLSGRDGHPARRLVLLAVATRTRVSSALSNEFLAAHPEWRSEPFMEFGRFGAGLVIRRTEAGGGGVGLRRSRPSTRHHRGSPGARRGRAPLAAAGGEARSHSYGQKRPPSIPVDRFGVWLSRRSLRPATGETTGKRLSTSGCSFEARTSRHLLESVSEAVLVDVAVGPELAEDPKVKVIEGLLPAALAGIPDSSLDVALCMSVLEHLGEPDRMLAELRRVVAPGGVCVVNVPNWLGKRFLEILAFRLGLSPVDEMDDHKT